MRKLIRFYGQMGRSADLEVLQVVDSDGWDLIQKAISEKWSLPFGEIAGKHSDVDWTLEAKEITIISEDEAEIDLFIKWIPSGRVGTVNLIDKIMYYIEAQEDEEFV